MSKRVLLICCSFTVLLLDAHQLVITTWSAENFQRATARAWKTLRKSDDRIESLLDGLSECERLQCDGTVGFGGSPDETGETRLDALVFDGPGHKMGAVGSLRRVRAAARVAYAVMKYTKHSFLVGEAATKFAIEMGFKEETLSTNRSHHLFKNWTTNNCQPNFRKSVLPDPRSSCGPYRPADVIESCVDEDKICDRSVLPDPRSSCGPYRPADVIESCVDEDKICDRVEQLGHDTIGMAVIDSKGNMAAGTSTNGAIHKIPGRIGDSPIPGSGAYVDNEIGAAAATGDGDILMRFLPSYQAVEGMRYGETVQKAADVAILRVAKLYPNFSGALIAVNKRGEHAAACHGMPSFGYSVRESHSKGVRIVVVKCL
ncbi:N(4)-(Beta-N-acetylglucosaminyl)-L-asparaginase [Toxocara canis]|uniref:N(4)-(beta-N-acetylglucosaminyl)-L-asparaginase n=1 Tax=Toxocara canis TaxID=6265 RepID=A0A0B2V689_TOXCA|nr:N(4)-(Beta-N-acetylglucosaminyl)-L-asparaginase [Toxocara canis]